MDSPRLRVGGRSRIGPRRCFAGSGQPAAFHRRFDAPCARGYAYILDAPVAFCAGVVAKTQGEPNSWVEVGPSVLPCAYIWKWDVNAATRASAMPTRVPAMMRARARAAGATGETGGRGKASTVVVMNAMATIFRTKLTSGLERGRWGQRDKLSCCSLEPEPSLRTATYARLDRSHLLA